MHRARFAFLVGCFVLPAATARAQFFEYSSSVTISNVASPIPNSVVNGAVGPNGGNTATATDSIVGDSITFTGRNRAIRANGANHRSALSPPGSDINIMGMDLSNLSDSDSTSFDFDYTMTLTVTDYNSLVANSITNPPIGSGSIVVSGHLTGTYDSNQQNTTVFTMVPQGGTSFVAGDSTYQLSNLAFSPPSDISGLGGITTHIASVVPEPASMSLLGIAALGMCRRIRRRN